MPCPYNIIFGRDTALPWTLYHSSADTAMPCPYNIIFGRDTALPWTPYHSGAAGIEMSR